MFLLFVIAASAWAQRDDAALARLERSKREITTYLSRQARVITDRAAAEFQTPADWEKLRAKRLEEMRDMLGLLPWPARTPLNVRKTGEVDGGDFIVERLAYESLPKIYVTANLYRPKQRSGRLPAVVYVCGHAYSRAGAKAIYQHHGISLARNGYVAIILDPIQIAETYALHHGVYNQELPDWYARGYTPAGVEVWNAIRAIDYLETRPEVDASKIGMTGRSGGAAMTLFTAAVEPRIKAAMAAMGTNTYAATVGEANTMHCDCMFPINTFQHDMMHQEALIAPRPLLVTHGRLDLSFPVAGFTEVEQRMTALYTAYGHPERFRNLVVETGHADSDFQREQSIQWFHSHLKGTPGAPVRLEHTRFPEEKLAVFNDGAPADSQAWRVHEILTTRPASPRFGTLAAWQQRRTALLEQVRTKVFRTYPASPGTPQARRATQPEAGFVPLEFESEPGITIRAMLQKPNQPPAPVPALLYVASDGEDPKSIRQFLESGHDRNGLIRMIVYPRGIGEFGWDRSFHKAVQRDAMHLGQTVDGMRLWDVRRAIELLRAEEHALPDRITVIGRGTSGILGLYAAILDPRVEQVILMQPPDTHADGPVFLNVLRHTDLPEAAALLAPRRLNFYGRMPAAYEYTRHVYTLHGKANYVFVTTSLEAVLSGRYHHGFASGY